MIRLRRELAVWAVGVAWLGGIAAAFAAWESYDATPGSRSRATATDRPASGRWSLVMYAHPHCPCTRASLTELRELLAHAPVDVDVRVLFVRPQAVADGWERGESWGIAASIPGVRVECDRDGAEARRSGAIVSGHVSLHDRDGRLAFQGGITKARGRTGDNPGRRAVLALLNGHSGLDHEAPVFGCPLFAPGACCEGESGSCQR